MHIDKYHLILYYTAIIISYKISASCMNINLLIASVKNLQYINNDLKSQ